MELEVERRIEVLQRRCAARPNVLAMGGGLPARELFPTQLLSRAFVSALAHRTDESLQYGWPEGNARLRAWVADRLRARGADVDAEDVIVTAGAQQALAIATHVLRGERTGRASVEVDAESYPAALELFRACGAKTVTTMTTGTAGTNGTAGTATERRRYRDVACVYVVPGASNPRGRGLRGERREALLASGAPIIADEAYAELRFDGRTERPLLADARDRVWHVGTVSKALCPGLRVGWLVPPRDGRARALRLKHHEDLETASLSQAILAELFTHIDEDALLTRARLFYRARAERLMAALRRTLPAWRFEEPEGGFSVFVETDADLDDTDLLELAAAHGVTFDPGRMFRASEATRPLALRVCYSAVSGAMLEEGVRRLAAAFREAGRWRR
jgi:2-aminoadipate transaminase